MKIQGVAGNDDWEYMGTEVRRLGALRKAIAFSRKQLDGFRKNRLARLKQFIGHNYSEKDVAGDKVPVNFLELAISIYVQHLAASAPRALFTTVHPELKPDAATLSLGTNHLIDEIDLQGTFQRAVMEAMFAWGIVKVGMNPAGTVEVNGVGHNVMQPFADVVSLDDFVYDVNARSLDRAQFLGDFYEVPIEYLRQMDGLDREAVKKLQPDSRWDGGEETARQLTTDQRNTEGDYLDMVTVGDVFLPTENQVVMLPRYGEGPPLRVVDWEGPERGPYKFLSFQDVPDNIHPLAPTALWVELHDVSNRLWRKLFRQAERQKTIGAYSGGAKPDADRIMQTNDGELVQVDSGGVKEHRLGGPDQVNLALALQLKSLFTYMAGNLDSLGGLSPQSETVGQDQLLAEKAGNRVESMRARTERFAKEVIHDLASYLYYDPLIELPLVKRVPGADVEIPVRWAPEDRRETDFLEYNFTLVPYSMQHVSPAKRLNILQGLIREFVAPFVPMLAQQGISLNFEALLKKAGRYANIPEDLDDILVYSGPPQEGTVPIVGESPRAAKPSVTRREYERVNRPGATRENADNALAQVLMGGRMQPAEAEAAFRSPG